MDPDDVKLIVKKVLLGLVLVTIVSIALMAALFPVTLPIMNSETWKNCSGNPSLGVCIGGNSKPVAPSPQPVGSPNHTGKPPPRLLMRLPQQPA